MCSARLPVHIEVSPPETDEPTWLLEWNGKSVVESRSPDAPSEAGTIAEWAGGPDFHDE